MADTTAGRKKEMRDAKIRMEDKHHEVISFVADAFGLDFASYVRRAALKEARADLAELQKSSAALSSNGNVTRLNADEATNFLNYIESSPKPNDLLASLTTRFHRK